MFRPQSISSTDARKHFTNLIKKVSFSSKSFVIQSYHQPLVRLVNEHYIKALEEVVGKKTVNQIMQIAGNDRLFESEKIEQIKKVFQRRLSGSPQQPNVPPPQKPATQKAQKNTETQRSVVAKFTSPVTPKPPTQKHTSAQPQTQKPATVAAESHSAHRHGVVAKLASPKIASAKPQPQKPQAPQKPKNPKPQTSNNRRALLLSNGKNYK